MNNKIWRLLNNRIPTIDNLIRRIVLQLNVQLCVGGCGNLDDVDHLLLICEYFLHNLVSYLQLVRFYHNSLITCF